MSSKKKHDPSSTLPGDLRKLPAVDERDTWKLECIINPSSMMTRCVRLNAAKRRVTINVAMRETATIVWTAPNAKGV